MARSVVPVPEAGFFARHWLGLLGVVVAANVVAVGAILFEPEPARAQSRVAAERQDEDEAAGVAAPAAAVSGALPTPAEQPEAKPIDLKLPGYLPPLKGMPVAAALPIGPDGQPMSPDVAEGFAMLEEFRVTLDRLLGEFDRAGRTHAAAEAFNRAFAAEAARMSQRAAKLDVNKLPDRDQARLRDHAEQVMMPLIRRMQSLITDSVGEVEEPGRDVESGERDLTEPEEPIELEEELPVSVDHNPSADEHLEEPDPLTRAILE